MRLPSMTLRDLARREVETASVESTLAACAQKMRRTHVGCLVVAEPAGALLKPLGMLTDRDIVVEAVAHTDRRRRDEPAGCDGDAR